MTTIEWIGEGLARRIERRQFLRRSAATIFGVVAAWAARGIHVPGVLANVCYAYSSICNCSPLNGWYCDQWNAAYCNGALCSGGCGYDNSDWGQACWCTPDCNYNGYTGYFECCDCDCIDPAGHAQGCTCHDFIQT